MQHSRLRLIDLNYHVHRDISNPEEVLSIHAASQGYAAFLKDKIDLQFIKHANYSGELLKDNLQFTFFKGKNRFWHIPFAAHRYIKKQQPDFVLVQGLVFPLQVIILRMSLGKKSRIIVQHHGEKPFAGIKGMLQRFADRFIDAYIFTSLGNAGEWINRKIIASKNKCYEVLEASTHFEMAVKATSKALLHMNGEQNFLWVGRLHILKDPITILAAFEQFIVTAPAAQLYMVYQTTELLPEVKKMVDNNELLKKAVHLVGAVPHHALPVWFSAADFFISGSHKEGSGYALIEAMACGCIPVVTNIPSFKKITANGRAGFLFEPGNAPSLVQVLQHSSSINRQQYTAAVIEHFRKELSFKKIADDLLEVCLSVKSV